MATSNPILRASKELTAEVMNSLKECLMPEFHDFKTIDLTTGRPTHLSEYLFLMSEKTLVPHSKVELSFNLYKSLNKSIPTGDKGKNYLQAHAGKLGFKSARTQARIAISSYLKKHSSLDQQFITAKFRDACFCTGGASSTFGRQLKYLVNKNDTIIRPITKVEALIGVHGAGLGYAYTHHISPKDLVGPNGIRFNKHASMGSPFMVNALDPGNLAECLSLTEDLEREIRRGPATAAGWYDNILDNPLSEMSRTQYIACVSQCKSDYSTEAKARGLELREYIVSPKCITNIIAKTSQAIGDHIVNLSHDWNYSSDTMYIMRSFCMKGFNLTGGGPERLIQAFQRQINYNVPDDESHLPCRRKSAEEFSEFNFFLVNDSAFHVNGTIGNQRLKMQDKYLEFNPLPTVSLTETLFGVAKAHSGDDAHFFLRVGAYVFGVACDFSSFDMTQNDKCTRAVKDELRDMMSRTDPVAADLWYKFNTRRLVVKSKQEAYVTADGAPSGINMISVQNDVVADIFLNRVSVNLDRSLPQFSYETLPYSDFKKDIKTLIETVISLTASDMGFICKTEQFFVYDTPSLEKVVFEDLLKQQSFIFVGQRIYYNFTLGEIVTECDIPRFLAQVRYGRSGYMKSGAMFDCMTAISLMGTLLSFGYPEHMESFEAYHKSVIDNADMTYVKHSDYINKSMNDLIEIQSALELGNFTFFPMLNGNTSYQGILNFVRNINTILRLYRPFMDESEDTEFLGSYLGPFKRVRVVPSKVSKVAESRINSENFNKRNPVTKPGSVEVLSLRRMSTLRAHNLPGFVKGSGKKDNYEQYLEEFSDSESIGSRSTFRTTSRSDFGIDSELAYERERVDRDLEIFAMREEERAHENRLNGHFRSWS